MEHTEHTIHAASTKWPSEASTLPDLPHSEVPTSSNKTATTSRVSFCFAFLPAILIGALSDGMKQANVDETSDVTIAVMGATGTGKTTFINLASDSDLRVGSELESCTTIVEVAQPFTLDGRRVTLIDTPGFEDTTRSDTEILEMISEFLATTYKNGKKLSGIIYMHRISDFKMGGTSTRNFKMFRELCGENTLKNVVVVTNMWSEVSEHLGARREAELASQDLFFKPVLAKGAKMLKHTDTPASAHAIIAHIINNHPLALQIQQEIVDQKLDIGQTSAGVELDRELNIRLEKHRNEMRTLQEKMQEAIHLKDEETRQKLEAETREVQAEMTRLQDASQKLESEHGEDRRKLEKQMQEQAEQARQEAEMRNTEHNAQIGNLRSRIDETASTLASERANLTSRVEDLRSQRSSQGGFPLFTTIGLACDMIFGI